MKTLVLWDIDGTLVDVKGAGRRAFIHGIERAWGIVDDLADVSFAGATDLGVLSALRKRLHLPEERTSAFFAHMAEALEQNLRATADRVTQGTAVAVAGAADVVGALHRRGDVVQGLVTGNARPTAFIKLRHADVPHDHFAVGAFGDEHEDRRELAQRALRQAGPVRHALLIGDTANDVLAAQAIGATAIVLLRKPSERAALLAAGADHVVEELSAVLALVAARIETSA